jgi:hypothetical protein
MLVERLGVSHDAYLGWQLLREMSCVLGSGWWWCGGVELQRIFELGHLFLYQVMCMCGVGESQMRHSCVLGESIG